MITRTIKKGETVWAFEIDIARSNSRFSKHIKPSELIAREDIPYQAGHHWNTYKFDNNSNFYSLRKVYETQKECIEAYNEALDSAISRIKNAFEPFIQRIEEFKLDPENPKAKKLKKNSVEI